jgi:tellurite resistance protein
MDDFFESVDLGLNHVQVIIQGMYKVAKSDDVHATELVMLRQFYDACREEVSGLADFDDVISMDFDKKEASEILDTPELKQIFLKSCYLLAFADGSFSYEESAVLRKLAADLGMDDDLVATVREEVQDYLLQQISKIQNVEAVVEVAKEMKE